ncbi:MAG: histidine kinase [Bacteroidetes bacterium]|nr:MAG: histidine kinase [Bacteroidota bacterium]
MKDFIDYNESKTWEKLKHSLRSWKYIGVGKSLLIWFMAISIIPLGIVSFVNFLNAYQGLTIVADKSLTSSSQLRAKYLTTFFNEAKDYLEITSGLEHNDELIDTIHNVLHERGMSMKAFAQTEEYSRLVSGSKNDLSEHVKNIGYQDQLIIDANGVVLFSITNPYLVGQNLFTDTAFQSSRLVVTIKKSFREGKILFSDLERFRPSGNSISGFFVKTIKNKDQVVGADVVQFSVDQLNNIIGDVGGYGESGDAFILGSDLYLRTATRFGDNSEILTKRVVNTKSKKWKDYINHINEPAFLVSHELEKEKVSTYNSDNKVKYVLGIYRYLKSLEPYGVKWALFEEIEHNEAFAYARRLSDYVKLSFVLTFLLVFLISILVTRWFVSPIKHLSSWGKEVASGKLELKTIKAPKNEIGELKDTFITLVNSFLNYASVTKFMAKGDFAEKVKIRSNDDVLGKSINQMVDSFRSVIKQANKIAKGDYSAVIEPRSENDSLGKALYSMTETLRTNDKQIKEQNWLKNGLANLDKTLKGHTDIGKLSDDVLSFLCRYLDAQSGILYLTDEKNVLHLQSTFALTGGEVKRIEKLKPGEGLPGQVLKENKRLHIKVKDGEELPDVPLFVKNAKHAELLVVPFSYKDNVVGVIELGSVNSFDELKLNFLDRGMVDVGLSVVTLQSYIKVKELLEKTQLQARELEAQQEELRQTNEELQEQTKALKKSEEILQSQKEELKVTNEELEERSNALELQRDAIKKKNRELEQARKEIEKKAKDLEIASKYKSEFLANMSHELRTPLNSIIVLSQLMGEDKEKNLSEKQIEFVNTIHSSGMDLLDLINDILDLSKVESGKLEVNLEQLYLDDLINSTRRIFEPVIEKKGLKLITEIDEDLPEFIITDIQRVQQIIKNLISNAIKFTLKGTITMKIGKPVSGIRFINKKLKPESTLAISVIDTGIGIPREKQDLIFEAFRQADGTTSRRFGGTGLGLSISRNFSSLLGGEMRLESEENKGANFTLFLPYEAPKIKDTHYPDMISNKVKKSPKKRSGRASEEEDVPKILDDKKRIEEGDSVILIIEDDSNFAKVLMNLAHDHGFKAILAPTGEIGLFHADYYVPDAIILDIGLPGIDGYKVLEKLKGNAKTRHIPVHFISAADRDIEVFKMGAVGYLTKPVNKADLDNLFNRIENILSKPVKKLMIVEDETIMRKSIINLMRNENIEITAVDEGNAAYSKLENETYDCMILDLGLKDMTGFELLEKMDKNNIAKDLPVVIYTGKDLSKNEARTLEKYSKSIILKGAQSFERLLSETTLFLHQVKSELPENKQEMIEKVQGTDNILENKTILLVDDDMRNVFALSSLLESYQAKVIVGRNGKLGLEKLKEHPETDLVLLDIMMPEMDGFEVMKIIRQDKKFKDIPIIALTAKAMKEDREKCIAAGANEYLAKPVDTEKLISLLRVWLYK